MRALAAVSRYMARRTRYGAERGSTAWLRRRQGIVIVVLAVCALGVAAALLAARSQRYADTNSVTPIDPATSLLRGQQLCVGDLIVPAHAVAVSLSLATMRGAGAHVSLKLWSPAGSRLSTAQAGRVPGASSAFPIRPFRRSVPARLCLRTDAAIGYVGGTRASPFPSVNFYVDARQIGQPLTAELDGRQLPNLVTVRFLSPGRPATVEELPRGSERAAMFRPGFVRPWTYGVLAALVALLAVGGAVVLVSSVDEEDPC